MKKCDKPKNQILASSAIRVDVLNQATEITIQGTTHAV